MLPEPPSGGQEAEDHESPMIDHNYIIRQQEWSQRTFGPGLRTQRITDHIGKELGEIRQTPHEVLEWVDVIILAIDGAWRSGASPEEISTALRQKQEINLARAWPDWRTAGDGPIEHVRHQP